MTTHLCSEQLSECALGEPSPDARQHLEDCPACRAELQHFHEVLSGFRRSVRRWSENQANAALAVHARPSESRSWMASHQFVLALLLAAVCMLVSMVWHGGENAPASDAVLLNQVDAQVSRAVPRSMEPLTKLVAQE
jgi:anti-sigma factor RsiW